MNHNGKEFLKYQKKNQSNIKVSSKKSCSHPITTYTIPPLLLVARSSFQGFFVQIQANQMFILIFCPGYTQKVADYIQF